MTLRIWLLVGLCLFFVSCSDDTPGESDTPNTHDIGSDTGVVGDTASGEDTSVAEDTTLADIPPDEGPGDTLPTDTSLAEDVAPDVPPEEGLFVHAEAGEDAAGRGSLDAPFATIQYAVDQSPSPGLVHVAAGSYNEVVTLREGVSLLGGYSDTDWSDRDPRAWDDPGHRSEILAEIGIAVIAGEGITESTLLEGFYLEGGIEEHDHHSHGIYVYDGASPVIRDNKVHGGFGDQYSTGITCVSGASPSITHNVIGGGEAPTTYGMRLNETDALVANNLLLGRGGTVESYGVVVNNGSPRLVNNTIDAGDAASAYGLFLFTVATPSIINNIILCDGSGQSYGVFEATIGCNATVLKNNDLVGCDTALYHNWGGSPTDITTLSDLHAMSDTDASGNVTDDPALVSATDFHLQSSSPASVREGGLDQSALGIEVDMDRNPRTAPWSMGAYEQD